MFHHIQFSFLPYFLVLISRKRTQPLEVYTVPVYCDCCIGVDRVAVLDRISSIFDPDYNEPVWLIERVCRLRDPC